VSATNVSLLAVAAFLAAHPGHAEIADSSASGFTVKTTLVIQAAPSDVYRGLIRNVGEWWNPAHTFFRDSHNLSIEEKAMGCFCESLANRGAVRHMEVIYFDPGKVLRMSGAIGPLQGLAATGILTIMLAPADNGTKLEATYAVGGYLANGMNTWAAPVDSVISEQMMRLKSYVETKSTASKGK
jgi:hypothetical protein